MFFYLKILCIGKAYLLSEISFVFITGVGFSVKAGEAKQSWSSFGSLHVICHIYL